MASAPSGSKVPPRSAGRREPQGGRSEEASQTGSKLESVASSSRAHDPRSSTHNITSADIRGVLEHVRGKPLPKVLDTVLAAEGAKQEVDSVGNSPTEEKSKEQPKVKGNLGTQDYPPIDTGNRWKKVDDKIEDKKLKALLDDSKALNLAEGNEKPCQVSYYRPGKSEGIGNHWKVRVDVLAHDNFPAYRFEVSAETLKTATNELKKDMAFEPIPQRRSDKWSRLYDKLDQNPKEEHVVFCRKDHYKGFVKGADYVVRVWQKPSREGIEHAIYRDFHGTKEEKAIDEALDNLDYSKFTKETYEEWAKKAEGRQNKELGRHKAESIRKSGATILVVLKTISACEVYYKYNKDSNLYNLKLYNSKLPKAQDPTVLDNTEDPREARSDPGTALSRFVERLLDNWFDLRFKHFTGAPHSIISINKQLIEINEQSSDQDVFWIKMKDLNLNDRVFLMLHEVLKRRGIENETEIFYGYTNDSQVKVKVARKKKKGAADEPETLALQKAVDLDKAVKLILPVLSYDQVDPKNEKYKDLRKKLEEEGHTGYKLWHKETNEKDLYGRSGWLDRHFKRERHFVQAELGKTKTVVYGVAREEKAAIQQVVEQLSFKKVAIEEVPELFTSGKNLKDACEELYLALHNFPGCDLYFREPDEDSEDKDYRLRLMHREWGILCEASNEKPLQLLVEMRYSVAEYDNFRVFTFLQLSSATYAIDGGVIKREPRWEPLTKDTRIVRVDFKKFLKQLDTEKYRAEWRQVIDRNTVEIRIVNAQTNDVYLLVEDIDLHPAFETLQYLADFQHATESERGTRFASLDGKLSRMRPPVDYEIWWKQDRTKKYLPEGKETKGKEYVVRVMTKTKVNGPESGSKMRKTAWQKYGDTLDDAVSEMARHLDYKPIDTNDTSDYDLKELIKLVNHFFGRSEIFYIKTDSKYYLKVDHPLRGIQAEASGLVRESDKVTAEVYQILDKKKTKARFDYFLWEGAHLFDTHRDWKAQKLDLDSFKAPQYRGEPEWIEVRSEQQEKGIFKPIIKKCHELGIEPGEYMIEYRKDNMHEDVALASNKLNEPSGRIQPVRAYSLEEAVERIVYDMKFERIAKGDPDYRELFETLRVKGIEGAWVLTRTLSMNSKAAKNIHRAKISYLELNEDGANKIKNLEPRTLSRMKNNGRKDRDVFVVRVATEDKMKQHEFRLYYPYSGSNDMKKDAIHAMALHYQYDEITEDNYKKALLKLDPLLYDGEERKKNWDEIMEKFLPKCGYSRMFIRKSTNTFTIKIAHDLYGELVHEHSTGVDNLLSTLKKKLESLSKDSRLTWETLYKTQERSGKPRKKDEESRRANE